METSAFLAEFPPVATAEWEAAIRADLKGADAAKLIWHAEAELDVKPFYRAEDLDGLAFTEAAPGAFPYVRGVRAEGGWRIREEVSAGDPEEANEAAREAVAAGAQEIAFVAARVETSSDLGVLLSGLEGVPVHLAHADAMMVRLLGERLVRRRHRAPVSTGMDAAADLEFAAGVIAGRAEELVPFGIDAANWLESGATSAEQIGFALAAGVDLLGRMGERGVAADAVARAVAFSFATGPAYLIEIAKLRAFRMVWARALEAFGAPGAKARIHACTARWNTTAFDRHANILRGTTEAMAAVLGGADSISVGPFDAGAGGPDNSSRRLARNTQIILREEAMLGRVADAAGGSYCVEALTDALAAQAWKLMQEIEAAGGFADAQALVRGRLDQRVRERDAAVASRKLVLTGTNRFADAGEKAPRLIAIDGDRAACGFERVRLRTRRFVEAGGRLPRILLAEIGDAKMRAARSQFVADFLACAGLPAETRRFANAGEIARAEADLVVLCSADAEYAAVARDVLNALRSSGRTIPVMIAGNPSEAEQLREFGVVEFIHVRSEALTMLAELQKRFGIET